VAGDGPVNRLTHPPQPDRHVAVLVLPLPRTNALTETRGLPTQHSEETVVVTVAAAWQEVGVVVARRVTVKLAG
jgi:hypothetical protein